MPTNLGSYPRVWLMRHYPKTTLTPTFCTSVLLSAVRGHTSVLLSEDTRVEAVYPGPE